MFVSSGLLNSVACQRGSDPLPPSVEQTLLAKHRHHLHQKRISNNQSPLPQHSRASSSLSPLLSCFGLESGSVGYNTEAASSDASPAKLPQFASSDSLDAADHQAECLLDAVTIANTEKVQRLLRLTKRRCLSVAACALLLEWTPPGSVHRKNAGALPPKGRSNSLSDLSNGSDSQSPAELVSTLQQYREPLERFLLKLLAAASIVTPYSFVVALFYLKHLAGTIAKGGQRSIVLHQSNLHMSTLAALLVAVKVNGEDVRYQTLVEQFSVLAGCSVAELAAAERVMLAKLLTATSGTNNTSSLSLLPSPRVLQKFAEQDLLQASTPCNHDVTSGHHCWVSLLCRSIQPYPTEATVLSLASLCTGSESGRSSEKAFLPQGLQVVPEPETKWSRSVDSQALGSAFGDE